MRFLFILALITLNGVLAMSEIAVVSARRARLQEKAAMGSRGAVSALALAQDPGAFLSTVQIGITLVGILSGAFGGATLASGLAQRFGSRPVLAPYADALALVLVVAVITFLSLVLGELAPKRIGLGHAEAVAMRVAPTMQLLARLGSPVVRLVTLSSDVVLRVLRIRPSGEPSVTDEEVKSMVRQGAVEGIFEHVEGDMVSRIFRLSDQRAYDLMTPRVEVDWLDLDESGVDHVFTLLKTGRAQYPVAHGRLDHVAGVVRSRDLLAQCLSGEPLDLAAALLPPLLVPESVPALNLLELLRREQTEMALVIDEYGGIEGVVTLTDLLEALVGDITTQETGPDAIVRREDGSWLVDGRITVDDLKNLLGRRELPEEDERRYTTMAGFILAMLGRVPATGESFSWEGYRFEVVDMDGARVDRVLIAPIAPLS